MKTYGAVLAVKGVSFDVRQGSVTALLGGNGAGKTTTLSILMGVLSPTSGRVSVLGRDMLTDRFAALERMNFSSPYVDLPSKLGVREILTVYGLLYGVPRLQTRIADLAEEFDLGGFLNRPYGSLSAGQQTRVSLAKALINEPDLLLLDEPTASLDPDTADRVRGALSGHARARGMTIFMASHNMREVERMCDDVLMMRGGEIVDRGAPADLIARYGQRDLEDVFLHVARA